MRGNHPLSRSAVLIRTKPEYTVMKKLEIEISEERDAHLVASN
jgi:hypothetical protein